MSAENPGVPVDRENSFANDAGAYAGTENSAGAPDEVAAAVHDAQAALAAQEANLAALVELSHHVGDEQRAELDAMDNEVERTAEAVADAEAENGADIEGGQDAGALQEEGDRQPGGMDDRYIEQQDGQEGEMGYAAPPPLSTIMESSRELLGTEGGATALDGAQSTHLGELSHGGAAAEFSAGDALLDDADLANLEAQNLVGVDDGSVPYHPEQAHDPGLPTEVDVGWDAGLNGEGMDVNAPGVDPSTYADGHQAPVTGLPDAYANQEGADPYQNNAFPEQYNPGPEDYNPAPDQYDADPGQYGADPNMYGAADGAYAAGPNLYSPGVDNPSAADLNAYGAEDHHGYRAGVGAHDVVDPHALPAHEPSTHAPGLGHTAEHVGAEMHPSHPSHAGAGSNHHQPPLAEPSLTGHPSGGYGEVHAHPSGHSSGGYGEVHAHAGGAGGDAAGGMNVDALLAEEREKHEAALRVETAAREELEDMILRIEKHFKSEQAARKKAEEMLQAAISTEMESKAQFEDVVKKRHEEQKLLEDERKAIQRERRALEEMRLDFENELQAARAEVARAQEALVGSEQRIKQAEQLERARLEAEYQARIGAMNLEMEQMKEEMVYRMMVMNDEMESWRQLGQITANAVMEAKGEVSERKRELDHTKEKMDKLLDKLMMGRERGIELTGAISNNQRLLSFMPSGAGAMRSHGVGHGMGMDMGHMAMANPRGQIKLPPLQGYKLDMPLIGAMQPMGPGMGYPGGVSTYNGMPMGGHQPSKHNGHHHHPASPSPEPESPIEERRGPRKSSGRNRGAELEPLNTMPGEDPYAHVKSRFRQDAEEHTIQARNAAKARQKSARNKAKVPDRFEEANRDNSRVAAIANRWN